MSAHDWINEYVGVPYLRNGRDRNGWDCWGMCMAAFKEQRGVTLPDWRVASNPSLKELVEAMTAGEAAFADMAKPVNVPQDWDMCSVSRHRMPNHVGLYLYGGVLHSQEKLGTVWEPLWRFTQTYPHLRWWRCQL